ncbi:GntR family transcriptional regulator [Ammoniphilus resinae]|uniref:DNA-binding GntR family transcriptional regulator n=1 Tax=Ammoniphilus resinae TaxID=861532 RepID=A0ABS4GXD8_9BACL|nr:GntR family transcriptional regulator [Ammoniphilus resinae]MBP1934702.1 DNA-binding GntR family transcriptional regulator [Ammoniphilus resinae]
MAYEEIRGAIFNGNLKPGQLIVETELSEILGISRTPLREALALLEHEGLIETIPYKGTFIAGLDSRTVREIYDIRMILECRAIELSVGKIPMELLLQLESEILSAFSEQDYRLPVLLTGKKLHYLISNYSGNETLAKLIYTYTEKIHQYLITEQIVFEFKHLKQETEEHLEIVRALIEENEVLAKKKLWEHLHFTHQRTLPYFR